MSTLVFPSLAGIGWDVHRTEIWKNTVNETIGGFEYRVALWTYPRHQWDLTYDFLRQGTVGGSNYTEFSQLAGFFDARQGRFDSFLFTDPDDNTVTGQSLGAGDGTTASFQLVRSFGGFIEPILAPDAVSHVYVNGVDQAGHWTVAGWGTTTPGVITFAAGHIPASSAPITADFTYYFPVRFVDDTMDFTKFVSALYAAKKVSLMSLKN